MARGRGLAGWIGRIAFACWLVSSLALPGVQGTKREGERAKEEAPARWRVDRGEGLAPIWIPRAERLVFDVTVEVGPVRSTVAEFVMEARIEPYRVASLLGARSPSSEPRWVGVLGARAAGEHLGYSLDETMGTRFLPKPHLTWVHRTTQTGSENRRRELRLAARAEDARIEFRRDTHCSGCERREHWNEGTFSWQEEHHCDGCKRGEHRVWMPSAERRVPVGTLDMLASIHMARTLVEDGLDVLSFPMAGKLDLWNVELSLGDPRSIEVPAGEFRARRLNFEPSPYPGEAKREGREFRGLFGIHGTIDLWVDAATGIPLRIAGTVPVGILDIEVDVALRSHGGTPEGFGVAAAEAVEAGFGEAGRAERDG